MNTEAVEQALTEGIGLGRTLFEKRPTEYPILTLLVALRYASAMQAEHSGYPRDQVLRVVDKLVAGVIKRRKDAGLQP